MGIRGLIYSDWKNLGLSGEPNTGDNGVHASASPFEGLAEKMNWLQVKPSEDAFGAAIIADGLDEATWRSGSWTPWSRTRTGRARSSTRSRIRTSTLVPPN